MTNQERENLQYERRRLLTSSLEELRGLRRLRRLRRLLWIIAGFWGVMILVALTW
jgi:hypothetical protein